MHPQSTASPHGRKRTCGVYAITHSASGRSLIGSSTNIEARWKNHRSLLNRGKHRIVALQRDWVAYGDVAFAFTILERVDDASQLERRERAWQRQANADALYNVLPDAFAIDSPDLFLGKRARARGVYAITNKENGRRYIGSSVSIIKRWQEHRSDLTMRKHANKAFQADWDAYGPESFHVAIVEIVPASMPLLEAEQRWLDASDNLYNRYLVAGSPEGVTRTKEERAAMREIMHHRFADPANRERSRQIMIERYSDPEERRKQGERSKKALADPAVRQKLSDALRKRELTDEHRAKIAAATAARWQRIKASPEQQEQLSQRYSEAQKRRFENPQQREYYRQLMRERYAATQEEPRP